MLILETSLYTNLKIPSIRIKEQAYQTLVRTLVEYASTVWNPYTKTEINKIEAVQRRAARYVVNNQRRNFCCRYVLCFSLFFSIYAKIEKFLSVVSPGCVGDTANV
jgi:hypothetical protein